MQLILPRDHIIQAPLFCAPKTHDKPVAIGLWLYNPLISRDFMSIIQYGKMRTNQQRPRSQGHSTIGACCGVSTTCSVRSGEIAQPSGEQRMPKANKVYALQQFAPLLSQALFIRHILAPTQTSPSAFSILELGPKPPQIR